MYKFGNTYKFKGYAIAILLWLTIQNVNSQDNYRKHIIIAYETSTAFENAVRTKPEFKNALKDIFNSQFVTGFSQENQSILQSERANGLTFFDSKKDIISFFHFGIANSEFANLNSSSEVVVLNNFLSTFLKHKNVDWSASTNVETYFNTLFNIPKTPTNFGSGYTLNNLVYPLVLNQIDQTKYAEEYVLILLANNSAGDINDGYRMDQTLLGNIFGTESPSRDIIDAFSDELLNGYNRDTYFEFSFPDFNGVNPTISIKGYRIKPNIGNLADDHRQGEIATTFDLGDRFWPAHALAFATVNAPVAVATGRPVSSSQAVARTKATVRVTW